MTHRSHPVYLSFMRPTMTKMVILCLAGILIVCLFIDDPVARSIHTAASYSDARRLNASNWFTEGNFDRVLNPHGYRILVSEESKCKFQNTDVFLLVVIHSSPNHAELRSRQRKSSLSQTDVLGKRVVVVYLVGNTPDGTVNSRIMTESEKFRDIILEGFLDSYYNLTRKFMMGMRWASEYCPNARYVLKGDDDVYYNLRNIVQMLAAAPSTDFMSGYVYKYSTPYRNRWSKWYIPETVYPFKFYPPFCRGYAYVMSGDLPKRLFNVSQYVPFFPLDDVFTGFCVQRLRISPRYKVGFHGPGSDDSSFCSLNLSYAVHLADSRKITELWEEQQTNPHQTSCNKLAYYIANLY